MKDQSRKQIWSDEMNKKTMIIIAIVVLVVAIAGVFVGYVWMKKTSEPAKIETFGYTSEEMVCNIKDSRKMALIQVSLEATDPDLIETIAEKEFLLLDLTNKIIRDTTEDKLQGREGQSRLQEVIKERVQEIYDTDAITDIYFKKFVIQN